MPLPAAEGGVGRRSDHAEGQPERRARDARRDCEGRRTGQGGGGERAGAARTIRMDRRLNSTGQRRTTPHTHTHTHTQHTHIYTETNDDER